MTKESIIRLLVLAQPLIENPFPPGVKKCKEHSTHIVCTLETTD